MSTEVLVYHSVFKFNCIEKKISLLYFVLLYLLMFDSVLSSLHVFVGFLFVSLFSGLARNTMGEGIGDMLSLVLGSVTTLFLRRCAVSL